MPMRYHQDIYPPLHNGDPPGAFCQACDGVGTLPIAYVNAKPIYALGKGETCEPCDGTGVVFPRRETAARPADTDGPSVTHSNLRAIAPEPSLLDQVRRRIARTLFLENDPTGFVEREAVVDRILHTRCFCGASRTRSLYHLLTGEDD